MSIHFYNFPSDLKSDQEKESLEFGTQVAQAIVNQWWSNSMFAKRRRFIQEMRAYASGQHNMQYYKQWYLGKDCDNKTKTQYYNIDFDLRSKILSKKLEIIKNNIKNQDFEPIAFSIDPSNIEIKRKKRIRKKALVDAKEFLQKAKEKFSVQAVSEEQIPNSKEEVDVNYFLGDREKIEKAEETLIKDILQENKIKQNLELWVDDLTECGLMTGKIHIDPNYGIQTQWVDIEHYIHSPTKDKYFRDCKYHGQIKQIAIGDAIKLADPKINLTNQDLKSFLNYGFTEFSSSKTQEDFNNNSVTALFFEYEVSMNREYKVKKNRYGNPRIKYYKKGYPNKENKVTHQGYAWFQGIALINGETPNAENLKLIHWKMKENMLLDNQTQKPISSYVSVAPKIRKNELQSILSNAIPDFIEVQKLALKIQHLSSTELRPSITDIDISIFEGIDLGEGKEITGDELLAAFLGAGVRYNQGAYDYTGERSERNNMLRENPNPVSSTLSQAINLYTFHLRKMTQSMGLNELTDGSAPHPDTLSKSLELARLNSNMAIRQELNATLDFQLLLSERISLALNLIFNFSKKLKEKYINRVGEDDMNAYEVLKKRPSSYFGIYIDYLVTNEEAKDFQQDLNLALQNNQINIADRATLRRIKNIRLAELMLRLKIKQNEHKQIEAQQRNTKLQIQANSQSAIIKQEEERKTLTLRAQLESKGREEEAFYDYQKINNQALAQIYIDNNDFKGRKEIAQINNQAQIYRDQYRKDRDEETRIKVIDRQAENRSELIEQKEKGILPSFRKFQGNFDIVESNEDELNNNQPLTQP